LRSLEGKLAADGRPVEEWRNKAIAPYGLQLPPESLHAQATSRWK